MEDRRDALAQTRDWVLIILGMVLAFAAMRVAHVAVNMEARFDQFANKVEPAFDAGVGKAIESVSEIDAKRLGSEATDRVSNWIKGE